MAALMKGASCNATEAQAAPAAEAHAEEQQQHKPVLTEADLLPVPAAAPVGAAAEVSCLSACGALLCTKQY